MSVGVISFDMTEGAKGKGHQLTYATKPNPLKTTDQIALFNDLLLVASHESSRHSSYSSSSSSSLFPSLTYRFHAMCEDFLLVRRSKLSEKDAAFLANPRGSRSESEKEKEKILLTQALSLSQEPCDVGETVLLVVGKSLVIFLFFESEKNLGEMEQAISTQVVCVDELRLLDSRKYQMNVQKDIDSFRHSVREKERQEKLQKIREFYLHKAS